MNNQSDIMHSDKFCSMILSRINAAIERKKIRQSDLSSFMQISQSTLSKILKGEMRLTLDHVYKFSVALHIPIDFLLSDSYDQEGISKEWIAAPHESGLFQDQYMNEQILIRDVGHPAFSGYCGHTFNIYMFSTITSESFLLDGTLTLSQGEGTNICKAQMVLNTGKLTVEGKPIQKTYSGEMVISLSMGACYCVMTNTDIGEIVYLNFRHMYLFNRHLECRVGILSSSSSGGNRLPITQRILISHEKLLETPSEDSPVSVFIRGQLRLNNSKLLVSEQRLNQLISEDYAQNEELRSFFEDYQKRSTIESYYLLDEAVLRDISMPSSVKTEGLSILRNESTSKRYNKVSTKTDEFVFDYTCDKFNITP